MKGLFKFNLTLLATLLTLCSLLTGCNGQNVQCKKTGYPHRVKYRAQSLKKLYATELKQLNRVGRIAITEPGKVEQFKKQLNRTKASLRKNMNEQNIQNYSLYLKDLGDQTLAVFAYFETPEDTYDSDILPGGKELEWTDVEQVFYQAGRTDMAVPKSKVKRVGMVIGVRPRMVDSYVLIHKYTWPEVLQKIYEGNIREFSIYLYKLADKYYIFGYYEYVGDDFKADMATVDNDPATLAWIKFTDEGCQLPIPTRAEGEWWATMEEIFHSD